MIHARITKEQALYYEIAASWWASWMPTAFLQNLASSYFTWKVRRKYARYLEVEIVSRKATI